MPLLNDMARCDGRKFEDHPETFRVRMTNCMRRKSCARYVERNQGGPRTMTYAYLCSEGDDSYIPAEKPNDSH